MRGAMFIGFGLFLGMTAAVAQAPPAVSDLRSAFQEERAKSPEGPERAAADELVERAEAAAKANDPRTAARLFREARIALPRTATKLPEHVDRIVGTSTGLRQADRITGLAFSPDGGRLASSSRDGTVVVWNVENERPLLTYRGHSATGLKTDVFKIAGIAFAPNGNLIASSGGEEIHLWDAATGDLKHKLSGHKIAARGLAFTPDGKRLISGGDDRIVIIWDVDNGKQLLSYPQQSSRIEAVAVQAQSKTFATVNSGGELHVYPLASTVKPALFAGMAADGGEGTYGVAFVGATLNLFTAGGDGKAKLIVGPDVGVALPAVGTTSRIYQGTGKFYALSASADGKKFVTAGTDPTLRLWDAETGKPISATNIPGTTTTIETRETGLSAAAISPDGRWTAAGTVDGVIQIHSGVIEADGRRLAEKPDALYSVAVSPSGKIVAFSGVGRTISIVDIATGVERTALTGHAVAIPALLFVRDTLLASGSGDKLLKLWDTATGKAIDCTGHTSAVLCVAADAAGKLIASGGADRTLRLWNDAGKSLGKWETNSAVTSIALTADGKRAFVGTANGLLTALDLSPDEPKAVGSVQAHSGGTASLSLRRDGKRLLSGGGDGFARIWEVSDSGMPKLFALLVGQSKAPGPVPPLTTVAFSPDGGTVLTAGAERLLRVWDTTTNAELRGYRGHGDWITAAAFTADGRRILSVSVDKSLRIVDLPAAAASGHVGAVTAVAVSTDGKRLATAGKDRTIRIWSTADGRADGTLAGSGGSIIGLGFLTDDRLVSTGDDGRLRFWSVSERREKASVPIGEAPVTMVVDVGTKRVAVAVTHTEGSETTAGFFVYDDAGKLLADVRDRGRRMRSLSISADLRYGLSGGEDGTIRIWDLAKKEQLGGDWPLFEDPILDLGLAADGKTLVALDSRGRRKIGDLAGRAAGKPETLKPPASLAAAPKGNRHAVAHEDGTVTLYDNAGKALRSWKLPALAAALVFTPDGKTMIAGQPDGTAWVLKLP